jgi:radical SAM protein with 4Fe4S-binding SPASM domain
MKNNIELCEFLYFATTRCNCRCKHCDPKLYNGKDIEISSKKLIEQYEKSQFLKNNSISVAGGEPFLKEDLDEFIVYLDSHKIPTVISTNGWFTEKIEKLIVQLSDNSTVRFAISIDGLENQHDEIRRCKGIYRKAVNSALLLHDKGFNVQINMVVQKDNLEYLEEFDGFFRAHDIPVIYIPEIFVGEEKFNFTKDDIRKMLQYVKTPQGKKYLLSRGKWLIKNCHAGKNSWLIDCNGDIYTCCGGYYKDYAENYLMGSIREMDFDEVFLSDKKKKVYSDSVCNCEGCLLPRDIEREVGTFGFPTKLTYDEVAFLAEDLTNINTLDDYSVEESEWFGLETLNGHSFHWMRKKDVTLYVNAGNTQWDKLSIHYLNGYVSNDEADKMKITIILQGEERIEIVCELGESTANIDLPDDLNLTGLVKIDISVDKLWKPIDINKESSDDRLLGIGLFSIGLI